MIANPPNDAALHAIGEDVRRRLVGEARFEQSAKTTYAEPYMKDFMRVATTSIFGNVWARPGLDLKIRTLIVCVSDIATGHFSELDIHLQMALRMGWTRTELVESIIQMIGYLGAPATREAMQVATAVFQREDAGAPTLT